LARKHASACDPQTLNPAFNYDALRERLLGDGRVEGAEIPAVSGDRTLLLSARKVIFHGEPCVLSTLQDITSRRRAHEIQLRTQKLEALGTLAGGIAHDFNNLLLAVRGNAELVNLDLSPGHRARQWVAEISKASGRAADLVKRILAFSRPHEQHRAVLQLSP
jgi:signal transduction histidine kinase